MHYYAISPFAQELALSFPAASKVLDSSPVQWIVLAVVWAWAWHHIIRWVVSWLKDGPSGWENAAPIMLHSLGSVVGSKSTRFLEALKQELQNPVHDASLVFETISQPEQQMRELMLNLYLVFESLLKQDGQPRAQLKVNLAVIQDNKIVDIKYHYPYDHPVRSTIDSLNNPRSAIQTAIREKRLVVIESIRDAGEKHDGNFFVTDKSRQEEDGSLLCYPVDLRPLADVAFVVSVCYHQRASFRKRFTQSYKEILEPFALRLKLEYSLLGLKELITK
jgi:hypothetical protein